MKSKMLIFIVMLAAGAMMLTACGEESKESSATQSTTQSATQTKQLGFRKKGKQRGVGQRRLRQCKSGGFR